MLLSWRYLLCYYRGDISYAIIVDISPLLLSWRYMLCYYRGDISYAIIVEIVCRNVELTLP